MRQCVFMCCFYNCGTVGIDYSLLHVTLIALKRIEGEEAFTNYHILRNGSMFAMS